MQIDDTTHENASSAKVYTYSAEYEVGAGQIEWTAQVRQGGEVQREIAGSIPLSSPGVASVAEQAVRDAVVSQIDVLDAAATA